MRAVRSVAVVVAFAACGRENFDGYPVAPCDQVSASASFLWSENDHCYTRHDTPVELPEADRACLSLGGHTVSITDANENAAVATRVSAPARLGLLESSSWIWLTDEGVTYASWAAGQPAACPTGAASGLIGADGTWTSTCYSNQAHPFLCEIEPWLVRDDGHRYRIIWKRDDWFGASAACQDLGGHLATITSFDEAAFVAPILSSIVWLGASNQAGAFEWVTGEPFGPYAPWITSQPDATPPACMASLDNQEWFDSACGTEYRALCEIE